MHIWYSGTRLIRHTKGPAKKCRIIRVVGLTVVKCITKIQKGPKIKCRIILPTHANIAATRIFCLKKIYDEMCFALKKCMWDEIGSTRKKSVTGLEYN